MSDDSTPANPAPVSVLDRAVRCVRCGYDLIGLPPTGVCPECGTPVERSMRGDLLRYCGEEYLASLHQGLFWIQTSIIISIITTVGMMLLGIAALSGFLVPIPTGLLEPTSKGLELMVSLMAVHGWWCLSAPDPSQFSTNKGETPRKLIRIAITVTAIWGLVQFVTSFLHLPSAMSIFHRQSPASVDTPPEPQDVVDQFLVIVSFLIGCFAILAMIVSFFAAMAYIRWLAPRIPNPKAFERAGRLRWLYPVLCTVGAACFMLGPLIALVLHYNLLDWLRVDLKNIRATLASDTPA